MCPLYKFIYWLIPLNGWKSFLIEKHFNYCPKCREVIEESMLKEVVVYPDEGKYGENLWPSIYARLKTKEVASKKTRRFYPIKKWRWALAGFSVLVIIIISATGITYFSRGGLEVEPKQMTLNAVEKATVKKGATAKETKVIIESATVKGRPAKVYIFQPKNHRILIIWLEENIN